MKHILTIFICIVLSMPINAQPPFDFYDYYIEPESDSLSLKAPSSIYDYNSERGYNFPTKGTYRMLVIFVNIIYDLTPAANPNVVNTWGWNVTNQEGINIPSTIQPLTQYFDDIFDAYNTLPRQGFFTRFISECSFDSLVILGDFTSVEIKQSRIQPSGGGFNEPRLAEGIINYINSSGGLQARYGHNAITDYDNANCYGTNEVERVSNDSLDYVAFLVLNPTNTYGGVHAGSGSAGQILTGQANPNGSVNYIRLKLSDGDFRIENYMVAGIGHTHLKHDGGGILTHEFAHCLLGGNSFHTSGANHLKTTDIKTFIFHQQGYSIFSNSFRSCNAYERWRLGWRHPSNASHKIAANGNNSDILSKFAGTQTYYLRDFVTYGDVIRIKLPYKDNVASSNQYIWLENHQLGRNNKLDGINYHFYPGKDCIPLGNPGIYSYIQVGKDTLENTSNHHSTSGIFPKNETDNLRMINAEGNYNMRYVQKDRDCVNWDNRNTFEYLTPNPLSGGNDQTEAIITTNQTLQLFSDFTLVESKIKNGVLYNQLTWAGDNFDGFESGRVMDISSNPTPINATTYYAEYYTTSSGMPVYNKVDNNRDTRKKYLTGLSIKMNYAYSLPGAGDVFKVDICWDDYDVKQDVNWAGDIVLKGPEQVNLLSGKTIYLEQNLTPNQEDKDPISGFFAPPTKFTCESGSVFTMNPNSKILLKDKSSLIMLSGSTLTVQNEAQIVVEAGSTLIVKQGANLNIQGSGKIIVKSGGYLCVESGANVYLQDFNSVISMQVGSIYGANPLLFNSSSCLSSITYTGYGCIPNYSSDVYIQNEIISANRYIAGRNIYVGNSVTNTKPQGNVLITGGAKVIFDATERVRFDAGFKCDVGSSFEVVKQ